MGLDIILGDSATQGRASDASNSMGFRGGRRLRTSRRDHSVAVAGGRRQTLSAIGAAGQELLAALIIGLIVCFYGGTAVQNSISAAFTS